MPKLNPVKGSIGNEWLKSGNYDSAKLAELEIKLLYLISARNHLSGIIITISLDRLP